jgi:hypothetical protein
MFGAFPQRYPQHYMGYLTPKCRRPMDSGYRRRIGVIPMAEGFVTRSSEKPLAFHATDRLLNGALPVRSGGMAPNVRDDVSTRSRLAALAR